ncbi:hypothetical protein, partial [Micromonospora sp. R42004]|uniref:hypothetical protein n=1 Tax=Micromonospora sp. R42004 TaxID=2929777 RepID=UPI001FFBA800
MASPTPHDDDRFDWQAAEADLTDPTTRPDAEVVDLDDARARRTPRPRPSADDDGPSSTLSASSASSP